MSGNLDFISPKVLSTDNGFPLPDKGSVSSKPLELQLTQGQFKQLQKFLPSGYSLIQSKSTKIITRKQNQVSSIQFSDESTLRMQMNDKARRDAFNKAERKIKEPMEFTKKCEYLLSLLKKHRCGYPFTEPVDPEVLGIPDYFDVIKEPMDFSKVEKRLRSNFYKSQLEFENDINKIWDNALTYNKPNTDIYHMTHEIKDYFHHLIKEDDVPTQMAIKRSNKQPKTSELESTNVPFKQNKPPQANKIVNAKPLTFQEKKVLSEMIRQLPSEMLWDVVQIVSPTDINQEQEIEFDIDTLSPAVARELEELIRSKRLSLPAKKTKSKSNPAPPRDNQQATPQFDRTTTSQNSNIANRVVPNNSVPLKEPVPVNSSKDVKVMEEESDSSSFLDKLSESDD